MVANPDIEILRMIFDVAGPADRQRLYEMASCKVGVLNRHLRLQISPRKLARKLHGSGVVLSSKDLRKYVTLRKRKRNITKKVELSQTMARLESAGFLGDNFSPSMFMEEVVEFDLDPSLFSDMNVRELARPKNIIDWITGRKFLNAGPLPRQFEILVKFTCEWCPYCSDSKFMYDGIHLSPYLDDLGDRRAWTLNEILERVQLTEYGKCPKCKTTYLEHILDPKAPAHIVYTELAVCAGMRSGKTRMSEMLLTYFNALYMLLMPSPQELFGQDHTEKFAGYFTASTKSQGADTLWGAYSMRKSKAPWYRNLHKWLDDAGKSRGIKLYDIKATYHRYDWCITIDALKSPFAKALRGATGYKMAVDEIGMMAKKEGAIKANADEVYTTMSNSLLTLRSAGNKLRRRGKTCPVAPMVCVSSPWSLLDKIMTLVRTADDVPTRLAFHFPTWLMNPEVPRNDPQIMADYAKDPIKAERDYGARPPMAIDPFHANPDTIRALAEGEREPLCKGEIKKFVTQDGTRFIYADVGTPLASKEIPRILSIDAGETDNSFAITMWSLWPGPPPRSLVGMEDLEIEDLDDIDEAIQIVNAAKLTPERPRTVEYLTCDGIIEAMPYRDPGADVPYQVHFERMYLKTILPLIHRYRIVGVGMDRWNITYVKHALQEMGIPVIQYSLKFEDFKDLDSRIARREIRLLPPEVPYSQIYEDYDNVTRNNPQLHLIVQTSTVCKVARRVVKPSGGTDDIYRTMAVANYMAFNEDVLVSPRIAGDIGTTVQTEQVTLNWVLKQHGSTTKIRPGYGGESVGLVIPRSTRRMGRGYSRNNQIIEGVGGYKKRRY